MEGLMGPSYGLMCSTDLYMELCPQVCYFRQRVDKEMQIFFCIQQSDIGFLLCSTELPSSQNGLILLDSCNFFFIFANCQFLLAQSWPFLVTPTVSRTMPKVPIWASTQKQFSFVVILAILAFWQFLESLLGPFCDLSVHFQVINGKKCSFVIIVLFLASCALNSCFLSLPQGFNPLQWPVVLSKSPYALIPLSSYILLAID